MTSREKREEKNRNEGREREIAVGSCLRERGVGMSLNKELQTSRDSIVVEERRGAEVNGTRGVEL